MSETDGARMTGESDTSVDRSPDEIRRDIERRRESIARNVVRAGQKVEDSLDWRAQAREHPFAALTLAAGAGFLAAAVLRRKRAPRLSAALTDSVEEIGQSLSESIRANGRARTGIAQAIGTAVAAVAGRFLVQMVRDAVVENPQPNPEGGRHHEQLH